MLSMGLRRSFSHCVCVLLLAICGRATAATITVTDAGDANAVDGKVTLREAITSIENGANLNADVVATGTYGTGDTIHFSLVPSGVQTSIFILSPLPAITKPLTIDGTTQPGFTGSPLVFLDGLSAGATTNGLALADHTGSVIRSLGVVRFGGDGILVTGTGGAHQIKGCWIGVSEVTALGNGSNGIEILGVPNNTIGGLTAADRNVISANGQACTCAGIVIRDAGATGNVVQGNYIGTDTAGAIGLGNSKTLGRGVILFNDANGNRIGGTAPGAGNVISANGEGLNVQSASNETIQGNYVGLNASGSAALPNLFDGVVINGTSSHNLVGGTSAAARNLISGNVGHGVDLAGCAGVSGGVNVISGNWIGITVSNSALGNGGDGVRVNVDQHDSTIGGAAAGAGNIIALNAGNGVGIKNDSLCGTVAHDIAILGNSIHHNGGLGIDLALDGVTANDALDADDGVNGLQNYPVLTAASTNGVTILVTGTLNSKPDATYRLEFFRNPSCDVNILAEGQEFIGAADVTTDGSGNAAFSFPFAAAGGANFVTSTATDAAMNTSEFSACRAVDAIADRPPVAAADAFGTPFQTALSVSAPGVLDNDTDSDGDALTAVVNATTTNGTLVLGPDGSFTYTPDAGFSGIDTFTYHAVGAGVSSNVATVTITVGAPPPPTAQVPTLDFRGLLALAVLVAASAVWALKRA